MSEPTANQNTKCPNLLPIGAQNVLTYCQSEHKMSKPTANQSHKMSEPTANQSHKMSDPTAKQNTKCPNLQPIRAQNVRTYSQPEHKMSEPTTNRSTKCPNLLPIRAQNVQTYCQSEYKINIYFFLLVNEFQNKNSNILIRIFHHILIV
jgi:hypothetical protein